MHPNQASESPRQRPPALTGLVLVPADFDEFIFLSHRVGYTTDDWHIRRTKQFFERTFGAL